jgi:hypothetical protein
MIMPKRLTLFWLDINIAYLNNWSMYLIDLENRSSPGRIIFRRYRIIWHSSRSFLQKYHHNLTLVESVYALQLTCVSLICYHCEDEHVSQCCLEESDELSSLYGDVGSGKPLVHFLVLHSLSLIIPYFLIGNVYYLYCIPLRCEVRLGSGIYDINITTEICTYGWQQSMNDESLTRISCSYRLQRTIYAVWLYFYV